MGLVRSHCQQLGIGSTRLRTMLVEAFVTSHFISSGVVWGHIFGPHL